jgi:hypothetical protein
MQPCDTRERKINMPEFTFFSIASQGLLNYWKMRERKKGAQIELSRE